jgi:hypothetical protein
VCMPKAGNRGSAAGIDVAPALTIDYLDSIRSFRDRWAIDQTAMKHASHFIPHRLNVPQMKRFQPGQYSRIESNESQAPW